MAQIYFYYSAMNAGKSTVLLQSAYNYKERGIHTLELTPDLPDYPSVREDLANYYGILEELDGKFGDLMSLKPPRQSRVWS